MSLKDDLNTRLSGLAQVREEHVAWYTAVLQQAFYPDVKDAEPVPLPESFNAWYEATIMADPSKQQSLAQVKSIHDELHAAGDRFDCTARATQDRPPIEEHEAFAKAFEQFLTALWRLVRDFMLDDTGMDLETGLRSKSVLYADLAVEMDRLERQGRNFSIALMRIDHFHAVQTENPEEKVKELVETFSTIVKRALRSFDDGYLYEPGEFILCLKQTDTAGGIATVDRIRRDFEKLSMAYLVGGKQVPLSVSCCVASPFEGDDMEDLIKNLKVDLDSQAARDGSLVEYQEMSELQRYMKSQTD